jgi:uncharacterized membrane protein YkoI
MRLPQLPTAAVLCASLVLAIVAPVQPAAAEHLRAHDSVRGRDHDAARQGVNSGKLVPLGEVVRTVRARYPGELLDASLHELVPGQPVYRVLILTNDGRRLAVWVDARTGQILRVEG